MARCSLKTDLDIEALTKGLMDVSMELDQFLLGLLKPEASAVTQVRNVSRPPPPPRSRLHVAFLLASHT
jgi:hypothetical protein